MQSGAFEHHLLWSLEIILVPDAICLPLIIYQQWEKYFRQLILPEARLHCSYQCTGPIGEC